MHVQFHQQMSSKCSEINTLTSQGETKQYSSGIALWIVEVPLYIHLPFEF